MFTILPFNYTKRFYNKYKFEIPLYQNDKKGRQA